MNPPDRAPPGGGPRVSKDLTVDSSSPRGSAPPATAPSIQPGVTLDHFEILGLLGAGGFGQVYKARDTRLERLVAVKILPDVFALDAERRERLRREAIAASALNHSNICAVYDLVEASGHHPIVMELVEGKTLHAALADGPLPVSQALPIAIQIADALGEAHRAGILHRDIKSSNIAITPRGQVKVLDFGLAKLLASPHEETNSPTLDRLTAEGTTLGTLSYMSPEQLLAQQVDQRSDLFSVGVVLYEMLTGQLPFEGSSPIAVADAILHKQPRAFGEPAVPEPLKAIIRKLLQKDAAKRHASAEEPKADLKSYEESLAPKVARLSRAARIAIAAAAVVVLGAGGLLWHRASRARWALETATPEISRLIDSEDFIKAVALLKEARAILPKDPSLEKLWLKATDEVTMETVPPGADVSLRPLGVNAPPTRIGKTPLKNVRVPNGLYELRVSVPGHATLVLLDGPAMEWKFRLRPDSDVPDGMVTVPGSTARLGSPFTFVAPPVQLDDFLIDRHEVTNEEFKKFVDTGGYQRRELWKEPFAMDGRTLTWEEAVALFKDSTGRPGPATWEVGAYSAGQEKHPVSGVSWYEAAAYAEFAGKTLPTAYHWSAASQRGLASYIVPGSNFGGAGTRPIGDPGALSGFGTSDMAGNVKEWCLNESAAGKRFILGGGFADPRYMFAQTDAQPPFGRDRQFGFRCAKLFSPAPPAALAKLEREVRNPLAEKPVSPEVLEAFHGLYSYDASDLNAKIERSEPGIDWTREMVSVDAAYGGERLPLVLILPNGSPPPYQTVVYFPGAWAYFQKTFDSDLDGFGFLPKSGRALALPIYKGTYARYDGLKIGATEANPPGVWRDHMIAWSRDLGRSLDYLATRSEIDRTKLAFVGNSLGGVATPVLLGLEHRFGAAILLASGLPGRAALPEAEPVNFLARMKTPTLMLNGRLDDRFPMSWSQIPLFRLIGTPATDKKQVFYECGHGDLPRKEVVKETLAWLDKYLGPVKR